ncbi:hypothetical protein QM847_06490 [Streptococcus timonensis]|uniref:hypothetical protein n=1 Tax=Streptococcus timonensis TaxID=1852387 RepID=UPI0039C096DB
MLGTIANLVTILGLGSLFLGALEFLQEKKEIKKTRLLEKKLEQLILLSTMRGVVKKFSDKKKDELNEYRFGQDLENKIETMANEDEMNLHYLAYLRNCYDGISPGDEDSSGFDELNSVIPELLKLLLEKQQELLTVSTSENTIHFLNSVYSMTKSWNIYDFQKNEDQFWEVTGDILNQLYNVYYYNYKATENESTNIIDKKGWFQDFLRKSPDWIKKVSTYMLQFIKGLYNLLILFVSVLAIVVSVNTFNIDQTKTQLESLEKYSGEYISNLNRLDIYYLERLESPSNRNRQEESVTRINTDFLYRMGTNSINDDNKYAEELKQALKNVKRYHKLQVLILDGNYYLNNLKSTSDGKGEKEDNLISEQTERIEEYKKEMMELRGLKQMSDLVNKEIPTPDDVFNDVLVKYHIEEDKNNKFNLFAFLK